MEINISNIYLFNRKDVRVISLGKSILHSLNSFYLVAFTDKLELN